MRIVQGLHTLHIGYSEVNYLIDPTRGEFDRFFDHCWDPDRLGAIFGINPYKAPEEEKNVKGVLVPAHIGEDYRGGKTRNKEVLYVFDPIEVHHWDFILEMGISDSPETVPYVISLVMTKEDVEVDVYPDDYPLKFNFKKNLEAPAKKSQALKRLYGGNPNIHMEFHEKVF